MKKILMALLMVVSISAFAGNVSDSVHNAGFGKLSESEKAEVIKFVADKAERNSSGVTEGVSPDNVEKWVKIGSNIGLSLAGAAKELGVAVNDFSKTPIGQITVGLIVWHMLGDVIVHIFGGLLVWLMGFSILWFMIRRAYPDIVTYSKEHKNIFGNYAIEKIEKNAMADDNAAGWLLAFALILVMGIAVMFTF